MELSKIKGVEESAWSATVHHCQPLRYSAGALQSADRPAWVRSGSGMAWYGKRLAIAQDDANFVALVEPESCTVESVDLPAGHDHLRQFDDVRGNKKWKLDLESCCSFRSPGGSEIWMAFGSGSSPMRESVVVMESVEELDPRVRIIPAARFYASLRQASDFSGSELNLEGVAVLPSGMLRLFQRGNGAAAGTLRPTDAVADIRLSEFLAYLENPLESPVPALHGITRYEIGAVAGIRFTFTDAVEHEGRVYFLAAAEDSPDSVRDGPVVGVAFGVFDPKGTPHWVLLKDDRGRPFLGKAEGLAFDPLHPSRVFIAVDPDDPEVPCQLGLVELQGFLR